MSLLWFFALFTCALVSADQFPSIPLEYQFSYSTGDSGPAKMFREERRSPDGLVTGKYGYVDPYGQMRVVQYEAGPQGYIAHGDTGPDREAMRIARQLAEEDYREKLPILQQWNQVAAGLATPPTPTWLNRPAAARPEVVEVPTNTEVERARLTTYPQIASKWAEPVRPTSYVSSVNHYANNIQTVWPESRSARIQAAPAPITNGPYSYFTLSQGGSQPYSINYSY